MEIELKRYTVRQITEHFSDLGDDGVTGLNGNLDIRPPYQREFVYDEKKREAVIDTICKGFPLNVMYWMDKGDGKYEILDGQQRTMSFCQYVSGAFSINERAFHNLTQPEKDRILDYETMIYVCRGNEEERLQWFQTINIAGEKLLDQEIRNAVYNGPWTHDAKRYFSKQSSPVDRVGDGYISGKKNRQEYLEKVLEWISNSEGKTINQYMNEHMQDKDASALWIYFNNVMNWAQTYFPKSKIKTPSMKQVDWGILYNKHHDNPDLDRDELVERVNTLLKDEEVQSAKGVFSYVLDGQEKSLNLRSFTDSQKETVYARQGGICPHCKKEGNLKIWELKEMEADHIQPWHEGGKTVIENCQMLCKPHNRIKGGK